MLVRGWLGGVWRLWRGRFVVFEDAGYLAEETFLLLGILRILRILAVGQRGRQRLFAAAEDAIEESRYRALLVAGFVRLGASYEGCFVIIRTGRRREAVRGFVELHVDYA